MADAMDVDGHEERGSDSMGEEAEWQPDGVGQRRSKRLRAATKVPISRARKRKRTEEAQEVTTSHSVISQMKQGRDYEKRATTKILSREQRTIQSRKKGSTPRRSRKKRETNKAATTQLIHQKTNQNVLHSNVPLTTQEKLLQRQYELIEALVEGKKQVSYERDDHISPKYLHQCFCQRPFAECPHSVSKEEANRIRCIGVAASNGSQ